MRYEQLALKLDIEQSNNHIDLLHSNSDGFITLANKIDGDYKQRHYKYKQIKRELELLVGIENTYISQNTFYKTQRRIETIRQIRNCYIDLDCYKTDYSKDNILYVMNEDYYNRIIPRPNLVIDSGRGMYFIWNIEPVPYKALPLWSAVEYYFYNQLKDYGADRNCVDPTRVLRLAGTINSKTNTEVQIIDKFDYQYTLREIQSEYLPELAEKKKKKPTGSTKVFHIYKEYTLYYARIMDLNKLCELRNWDIEGQREVILFLYRYWSCYYIGDTEEALRQTMEFNEQFISPLSEREVIKATKSAEKAFLSEDKQYKYKNETLLELLEITEEEQKHMKTIIGKREKYDRKNEARNKKRRNKNGLTSREQDRLDKLTNAKKMLALGYKRIDIAKFLGVSDRYIRTLLSE
jgi:hypothetical protein